MTPATSAQEALGTLLRLLDGQEHRIEDNGELSAALILDMAREADEPRRLLQMVLDAPRAAPDRGGSTYAAILLTPRHAENELGLREGQRLLSAYPLPTGARVWAITEADRSATTLLLPEEY